MRRWFDIGDVERINDVLLANKQWLYGRKHDRYAEKFAGVASDIEIIRRFEVENGTGSFLNLDHPFVISSDIWAKTSYDLSKLNAAAGAIARRAALLKELKTLPHLQSPETGPGF